MPTFIPANSKRRTVAAKFEILMGDDERQPAAVDVLVRADAKSNCRSCGVEIRKRLIEQPERGLRCEHARHGDAAALTRR